MKTRFWILLIAGTTVVCLALCGMLLPNSHQSVLAEISLGEEVIGTVDLSTDQEFTIFSPTGGSNTVTVKDGKIAVTGADCPDGCCMARGFCSSGPPIVCLPHRLVIRFLNDQQCDAITG